MKIRIFMATATAIGLVSMAPAYAGTYIIQ